MGRTQKQTNKIIDAGDRLDAESEAFLDAEDELDEDSSPEYDPDDISPEDMIEATEKLDPASRRALDATRQRGRSPHKTGPVHTGRAKQVSKDPRSRDRDTEWRPADTLFAPAPRPGMENRWIRIRLGEKDDPRNFQKKFREGWKPVSLSAVSEELEPPSIKFGRFGDVVAVSDLVLCERPLEIGISRKRYFKKRLERQLKSADRRHVDRVERDDHKIMGGARMQTTAELGRKRKAAVQDDE